MENNAVIFEKTYSQTNDSYQSTGNGQEVWKEFLVAVNLLARKMICQALKNVI
jgi:hypothetical protein